MKTLSFIFLFLLTQITMKADTLMVVNSKAALNVHLWKNAGKESIILLHGGPGVPDYMDSLAAILSPYFNVITFDQRGTGGSLYMGNDYSPGAYFSDINAVVDKLGIQRFHLLGHSWGGLLAMLYTANYPARVQSLFLASPSSGTGRVWTQMEREVMQYNRKQCTLGEWLKMGWRSLLGAIGSDKAYRKVFAQVWLNYNRPLGKGEQAGPEWLAGVHADAVNLTRKGIVKYSGAPALKPELRKMLTYGDLDIYGSSKQEMISLFGKNEYSIIEHCGHIPWLHNKEAFINILGDFYDINSHEELSTR